MKLNSATVLITGGASGIGLALAERFARAGSQIIVCGRRESALEEVRKKNPAFQTRVCDVGDPRAREDLAKWVIDQFPALNVLVNNAGIQRYPVLSQPEPWSDTGTEIAINLEAPIHLSTLLIPHLLKQAHPAILQVTSGLAFVPLAKAPVYSATKAALHSFTLSLRHQLAKTSIEVIEIAPPAVDTDLGGPGLHTFGVPLDEFADAVIQGLERGDTEITHGFSRQSSQATRAEQAEIFKRLNG